MNRLFGKKKPEAPVPQVNVGDIGAKVDGRVSNLDSKINKLDQELLGYKQQMAKTRNPAAKNSIKKRAMQVLKRKKMYEQQRDATAAQGFNIDQAAFAIESTKDTIETAQAMKSATHQLKSEMKRVDLNELEDVQDDMTDLLEDMEEMQEIMGRSYGIGDEIDDADLEAELDGLEDEWESEQLGLDAGEPSYLAESTTALPDAPTAAPAQQKKAQGVDEFGLPTYA